MVSVSRILFIQRKAADCPGKRYTTRAIETEPYMYCNPQYPPPFPSMALSVIPTVAIQEFSVVFRELAPYSVGEFAFCLTQKIKTIKYELPLKFFKWNLKSLHYLVWLTSPVLFLLSLTLGLLLLFCMAERVLGNVIKKTALPIDLWAAPRQSEAPYALPCPWNVDSTCLSHSKTVPET